MKSTDIIQPVAMATPIAVSGSKDEIPQEQANVQLPWYCSIEQGFPDITMTALNQGGRPPRGQGMNGLLNLVSDQKVYLQNGGILTFNTDVSAAIGGYPQGAILDYVNGNTFNKVISLVDDNTVNFNEVGVDKTNWQLLDMGNGGGGGTSGANTDLTNLTADGNAKFQYAPFAINNGVADSNGSNATLTTAGGVPVSIDTYVVPVLNSNTSSYGTCSNYLMTLSTGDYTRTSNPWTMQLASDNYIPANATVTFTIKTRNYRGQPGSPATVDIGCQGCKVTYTYTDDTTEDVLNEANTGNFAGWNTSGDKSAEITLPVVNKTVKAITVNLYGYYVSAQANWLSAWGITFKAQYTVSSSDTLIVNPCTITTADSRTKTFTADNVLDCSSVADGTYYVMKSYTDGSLTLADTLNISKTEPSTSSAGDLWLDSSQYPLALKEYSNGTFTVNNDFVSLGTITISSGVITEIKNNYFNVCPAMRYIIETYQNGSSWYEIYSDGWLRQGGNCTSGTAVTLLKAFTDTNYTLSCTYSAKNAASFTPSITGNWIAEGF